MLSRTTNTPPAGRGGLFGESWVEPSFIDQIHANASSLFMLVYMNVKRQKSGRLGYIWVFEATPSDIFVPCMVINHVTLFYDVTTAF
jgi:hypothetical protein